jgi:hypothetical protein
MRNIHIVHASRGRASQAEQTYRNWSQLLSMGDSYTVAIEADQLNDYRHLPTLVVPSKTAISAFNLAAQVLSSKFKESDIIIALSDDFPIPCDLDLIRDAVDADGLLKTYDGVQNWIVTLPIMGAVYYQNKGYIYPPQYSHMFADTHITHEAEIEGKLQFRNDITIKHYHYSTGGSAKDELNDRNDKTFVQGKITYLQWAKNKPLPQSREAQSLRNWINQNS